MRQRGFDAVFMRQKGAIGRAPMRQSRAGALCLSDCSPAIRATMPRPAATAVSASRSARRACSGACPNCGAAFDCGAPQAGSAAGASAGAEPFVCWCAALPPLRPAADATAGSAQAAQSPQASGACLCPECLAAALAEQAARAAGIPAAPLEEKPAVPAPRSKLRR
nr:cysteine-rich CWC family protein [Burkholderia gladioli]